MPVLINYWSDLGIANFHVREIYVTFMSLFVNWLQYIARNSLLSYTSLYNVGWMLLQKMYKY
jgi:hypothetical protein